MQSRPTPPKWGMRGPPSAPCSTNTPPRPSTAMSIAALSSEIEFDQPGERLFVERGDPPCPSIARSTPRRRRSAAHRLAPPAPARRGRVVIVAQALHPAQAVPPQRGAHHRGRERAVARERPRQSVRRERRHPGARAGGDRRRRTGNSPIAPRSRSGTRAAAVRSSRAPVAGAATTMSEFVRSKRGSPVAGGERIGALAAIGPDRYAGDRSHVGRAP